jgi:predicted NAD/FAD-binding protein
VTIIAAGVAETYDHVVIGAHADQALRMLADPDDGETRLLSLFRYGRNDTILHTDARLMPRRRSVWSSWNYLAPDRAPGTPFPSPSPLSGSRSVLSVTYWMNRLQALPTRTNLFVTLNPHTMPPDGRVLARMTYEHPILDGPAIAAQPALWSLQGHRRTWFCGAWFGAGFHEDGLQSGLAVAEQLGGVRRPWRVANESGRIHVGAVPRLATVA